MAESSPSGDRGLQEALRTAVERTLAATAGSAAETRGRAQELLDEVARRGTEARDSVARRMSPSGDDLAAISDRVAALEARLAELEARAEPEVEPER